MSKTLKSRLIEVAQSEGFSLARVCRPDAVPGVAAKLTEFLDAGYHGQMTWMAERAHWRGNPGALWPDAKSILMLAESYTPDHDPIEDLSHRDRGMISVYARNKDYHDILKKRLKRVARWLVSEAACEVKVFVDTAPVPEKPLGQAAGLGWQGKHTNLVSRDLGNWFFLGAIFMTEELDPDHAEVDHCGSCRRCLDICPTDAFPAPYKLDARRCISYLTIEHKGPVARELRPALGNRIYGCDDCLAVCPWNKFASTANEIRYAGRPDLTLPLLAELVRLSDTEFRAKFSGSPIKRIGRDRFVRNVLYAIGNSGDLSLVTEAHVLLDDPDPAVSDAAKWAIETLTA
ncbi:MAG: tRNA epoxyqueuosine(34) reductase QueG [Boseongicola sp.]|nr:MAG: tRNA epoxyqueuosine(34) reductase QueG [Boseongicola sp.]